MRLSTLRVVSLSCSFLGMAIVLFAWCSIASAQSTSTTTATCGQCSCKDHPAGTYCTKGSGGGVKCSVTGCENCKGTINEAACLAP